MVLFYNALMWWPSPQKQGVTSRVEESAAANVFCFTQQLNIQRDGLMILFVSHCGASFMLLDRQYSIQCLFHVI